jgi:hypothetical protein
MKEIVKNILSSLDNHSKGYSARKLSALWLMVLITILDIGYIRLEEHPEFVWVLAIHILGVLLFLGIVTAANLITVLKLKKGENSDIEGPENNL